MQQIHRELLNSNHNLQFGGIDIVRPGYRYVGVTYSQEMQDFLRLQVKGDRAWNTVLTASEELVPRAVFQFLPAYEEPDRWYLTLKAPFGTAGISTSIGAIDLKYVLKRLRSGEDIGWMFQSAIIYSKAAESRYRSNPFCDFEIGVAPSSDDNRLLGVGRTVGATPVTWSEYIREQQANSVDAIRPSQLSAAQQAKYGLYNDMYPTPPLDRMSAMAIELEKTRQAAKLAAIEQERNNAYRERSNQIGAMLSQASWEMITPPSPPEPVAVKAKYGRMIKLDM